MQRHFDRQGKEIPWHQARGEVGVLVFDLDEDAPLPDAVRQRRIAYAEKIGGNPAQVAANTLLLLAGQFPVKPDSKVWEDRDFVALPADASAEQIETLVRRRMAHTAESERRAEREMAWFRTTSLARAGVAHEQRGADGRLLDREMDWGISPQVAAEIKARRDWAEGVPVVVVTRHRGVLDWLRSIGAPVDTWEVISHVNRPEEIQGKLVIGALPLHLAAAAHGIGSIDMPLLLPEQRGKDLSVAEMRDAGAYLRFYRVTQEEMPSWVKNWA